MEPTQSNRPRDPLRPFAAVIQPLWRSALLVLIALGGAGLAVGVDRPQTSAQRPELSWRADQQAAPWIARLSAALAPLDSDVSALSGHAQGLLGNIIGLQLDEANTALAAGDEATTRVASAGAQLAADRDAAFANLATWRLGDNAGNAMDRLNAATDAVQQVPGFWQSLSNQARLVIGMIRELRNHDDVVFQATAAGRESRWSEALRLLEEAGTSLDGAVAIRNDIAAQGEVTTLDDLVARYGEYDAALADLYAYIRDTGNLSGSDFESRQQRVERAQAALPMENSAMTVIAAEAAAQPITEGLLAIERARGAILDAQEAVLGSPEPTTEPEPEPEPEPGSESTTEPESSPGEPGLTAEPSLPPA